MRGNLEGGLKKFRMLLVEAIDEDLDSSLYSLEYHLLDKEVKDIRELITLYV